MRLPVSGLQIAFRAPDGNDDLALLEATGSVAAQALAALPRLASFVEAQPYPWPDLTVTDFEAALLGLRRFLFGDKVSCIFRDPVHACGVPMELDFSITDLLADIHPRTPRGVEPLPDKPGWFTLHGSEQPFRLPTAADQLAILGLPDAATQLAASCIPDAALDTRLRNRTERAMQSLAPPLSRALSAPCPDCGEALTVTLHVPRLVLDELRLSASALHEDIHAIAALYHWDQATILALPQTRRRAYADLIRRQLREVA